MGGEEGEASHVWMFLPGLETSSPLTRTCSFGSRATTKYCDNDLQHASKHLNHAWFIFPLRVHKIKIYRAIAAVVLIRAPALQGNNNNNINGDINQVMVKEETFALRTVRFVQSFRLCRKELLTEDRMESL